MGTKVFISYPESQLDKAGMICNRLESHKKITAMMQSRDERQNSPSYIVTSDHFLPLLSNDGLEDEIFMEEISTALKAFKQDEKPKEYIIPLLAEQCDPGKFGLMEFPALPVYRDNKEEDKELIERIVKTNFLLAILKNPVISKTTTKIIEKLLWSGAIYLGAKLALLDEDDAIPKYNVVSFSAELPALGKPFKFLKPRSKDAEERWIKKYITKKKYSYLAFYFDDKAKIIGKSEKLVKLSGSDPEKIKSLPENTQLVMIAAGLPDTLEKVGAKIESETPLSDLDDVIYLLYG